MRRTLLPLFILLTAAPSLVSASRTPSDLRGENTDIYTVQSGDSLSTIAYRHHITVRALRQANNLGEQSLIHPGQKLTIPSLNTSHPTITAANVGSKGSPRDHLKNAKHSSRKKTAAKSLATKNPKVYKVRPGDTLSAIAREHSLSTRDLILANHLKADAVIRVGQTLMIPSKTVVKKPEKGNRKIATTRSGKHSAANTATKPRKQAAKSTPALYEVQSGDTLFSIARKHHTPLKDLMSLNKIAPTDVIRPGQKLKIPGVTYRAAVSKTVTVAKKKSPKASKPVVYTVKHGDSLWAIAHKHNVSIATLRKLNKLKSGQPLRSGMKLVLKRGETAPAMPKKSRKAQIYTVKKGDTLWSIARRHKTTVSKLRELNKLGRHALLHRGMKLTIGFTDIPETRLAHKSKPSRKKVKIAAKKSPKKKTHLAQAKKSKSRHSKADRRIHNALAALNSKGGSRSSGGGDYNVIRIAKRYLGHRYVWGAEGPNTFDCSGFTQYVMRKSKGIHIPRVSRKQAYYGKYVSRRNLKPGDLIFFDTSRRRRGYVNHVGIYIGNDKFIHASSARHRVVITSFRTHPFYRERFKWGRRID